MGGTRRWLLLPTALAGGGLLWWLASTFAGRQGGPEPEPAPEEAAPESAPASPPRVPPAPSPAEARVERAGGVFGRVTEGHGAPLAGASVALLLDEGAGGAGGPAVTSSATADDSGDYVVGPVPAAGPGERVLVRAGAPGLATVLRRVPAPGARMDLVLDPRGTLRLLVRDATGAPVAGARVRLESPSVSADATSDAEGAATFDDLPAGPVTARIAAVGQGRLSLEGVFVQAAAAVERVCALPAGLPLRGRVVEGPGSTPVAGARVSIVDPLLGGSTEVARSDREGRFSVPAAGGRDEQLRVVATKPGHGRGTTWATLGQGEDPGGPEVEVLLAVGGGAEVVGAVEDADGRPVAGARVYHANAVGVPELSDLSAVSDDAGRFALPTPAGFDPSQARVVAAAAGQGVGAAAASSGGGALRVRLGGAGSAGGSVRGAAKEPVEGAVVTLRPAPPESGAAPGPLQDGRFPPLAAATGPTGAWRLEDVPAGTYEATATRGLEASAAARVVVGRGPAASVDLDLPGGASIEGTVRSPEGAPLPGAVVEAADATPARGPPRVAVARTDAAGRFVLHGASGPRWSLVASAAGRASATSLDVPAGTRDVELRLPVLGWIAGTVEESDGTPHAGPFSVTATPLLRPARTTPQGEVRRDGEAPRTETSQAQDGAFRLAGMAAGSWRVEVRTPEGALGAAPAEVTVEDGRGAGPVRLRLVPGSRLVLTVLDAGSRRPVVGAWVTVRREPEDPPSAAGVTDAEGRFRAVGLAARGYLVTVRTDEAGLLEESLELGAGATVEREWLAPARGTLRVHVVDAAGGAVPGAVVTLETLRGTPVPPDVVRLRVARGGGDDLDAESLLRTDEEGVVERVDAPAGMLRVVVRTRDHPVAAPPAEVVVQSGQVTEVTVALRWKHRVGKAPR